MGKRVLTKLIKDILSGKGGGHYYIALFILLLLLISLQYPVLGRCDEDISSFCGKNKGNSDSYSDRLSNTFWSFRLPFKSAYNLMGYF